jgi:hypothetical protein
MVADEEEQEIDLYPFFEYLQSDKGHEVVTRILSLVEDIKKATLGKTTSHAVFEKWLQAGIVIVVVGATSILTYLDKFNGSVGILFGILVGYIFGQNVTIYGRWLLSATAAVLLSGCSHDEITVYVVSCAGPVEGVRCKQGWSSRDKRTFKVSFEGQFVVESSSGGPPHSLGRCAVWDPKNWKCEYADGSATTSMQNAVHSVQQGPKHFSEVVQKILDSERQVSAWEWWLVKFQRRTRLVSSR